jgi:phosphoglycolate phosphatase
MKKFILFDIDGTLTSSDGAGSRAVYLAMRQVYGLSEDPKPVPMAGKTDLLIFRELAQGNGLKTGKRYLDLFCEIYPAILRKCLREAKRKRLHCGVKELLPILAKRPDICMALLTGNLEVTAQMKLKLGRINRYFALGAYGSDHWNRLRLPAIARRRARELGIRVRPKHMVVIGDTPRDIECAHGYGARAIAVATGPYSQAQLRKYKPDLLCANLANTGKLVRWLEAID